MPRTATAARAPLRVVALAVTAALALLGTGACTRNGGSEEAYCKEARRTPDVLSLLSGIDSTDPEALKVRFAAGNAAFRDLEQASPRQIRPDVARLGDVVEDILTAVEEHPDDLVSVRDELSSLRDQAAGTARSALRVVDYTKKTCDIDLQQPAGSEILGGDDPSGPGSSVPGSSVPTGLEPGGTTTTTTPAVTAPGE